MFLPSQRQGDCASVYILPETVEIETFIAALLKIEFPMLEKTITDQSLNRLEVCTMTSARLFNSPPHPHYWCLRVCVSWLLFCQVANSLRV